jgi:hypothetical protein
MRGAPGNPTVALNKDGMVVVVWYDRRDDPMHQCWRLYGALSTDGGATFRSNIPLMDTPTCFGDPRNWMPAAETQQGASADQVARLRFYPHARLNGGETLGFVADRDGAFHVGWIHTVNGIAQLWHTSFVVNQAIVDSIKAGGAKPSAVASGGPRGERTKITNSLFVMANRSEFDFERGTLTVQMSVMNRSDRAFYGPFDLELSQITTDGTGLYGMQNFKAADADNGQHDVGATWRLKAKGDVLRPGQTSEMRTIRFTFDPFPKGKMPDLSREFIPGFTVYGRR